MDIQIQLQLDREEQFERQEQNNQNPTVGIPNVIERYFKQINIILRKYLTPQLLKMQHCQMNESLLYRPRIIENWKDLISYEVKELFFITTVSSKQFAINDLVLC